MLYFNNVSFGDKLTIKIEYVQTGFMLHVQFKIGTGRIFYEICR